MCSKADDPAYLSMQEAGVAALAHVLMEYDAGRIVVKPEPGMAVPPGGKPTRFHRAWADAILAALQAALQADPDAARAVVAWLGETCGEPVALYGVAYGEQYDPCAKPKGHVGSHDPSTAPQDDREAEIARIAAPLYGYREPLDGDLSARDIDALAAALYDAGLRATLARTRGPAGEGT